MNISKNGLELIKRFEGFSAKPYLCPGNVYTIGYGTTKGINAQTPSISREEAETLLREDILEYESAVNRLVKVELNQNQFDALVSWTYNLGEGNLRRSTLLRKLNAGDYGIIPSEMLKWNRAGGKILRGLTRRRTAEAELWQQDIHKVEGGGPEYTSRTVVPDVKRDVPTIINKENISFVAGTAGTIGLSSIASGEGPIQYAFAAVIVVGFAVGLFLFLRRRGA